MGGALARAMDRLARAVAMAGGLVLLALIALTCLSVLGRGLNSLAHSDLVAGLSPGLGEALLAIGVGPVTGDFELVEAGIAFAIFAFLPLCQLHSGHAFVSLFTDRLPSRANRALVAFWEIVLAAIIVLVTLRLYEGMTDKLRNGQTTFLIQFPVWWAYAASLAAAVAASIVAIYCAAARSIEAATGTAILPSSQGAER